MELNNSFKLSDFYEKELSVFQFEKIVNELVFENKLQYNYFKVIKILKYLFKNKFKKIQIVYLRTILLNTVKIFMILFISRIKLVL